VFLGIVIRYTPGTPNPLTVRFSGAEEEVLDLQTTKFSFLRAETTRTKRKAEDNGLRIASTKKRRSKVEKRSLTPVFFPKVKVCLCVGVGFYDTFSQKNFKEIEHHQNKKTAIFNGFLPSKSVGQ